MKKLDPTLGYRFIADLLQTELIAPFSEDGAAILAICLRFIFRVQSGKATPDNGSRIYSPSVRLRITSSQTGVSCSA